METLRPTLLHSSYETNLVCYEFNLGWFVTFPHSQVSESSSNHLSIDKGSEALCPTSDFPEVIFPTLITNFREGGPPLET